jgi:hypothetical protein
VDPRVQTPRHPVQYLRPGPIDAPIMDGQANSVRGANAIRAVGGRISSEAEQATPGRLGPQHL